MKTNRKKKKKKKEEEDILPQNKSFAPSLFTITTSYQEPSLLAAY
jgi:hypothetical protein